jgi:hypothetical protein
MASEVRVDIFSGRPNPVWALTPEDEAELRDRLRTLVAAERQDPPTAELPLGYRGLYVGLDGDVIHIWRRLVRRRTGAYLDPASTLERWLLSRAHEGLDPSVRDAVEREIDAL